MRKILLSLFLVFYMAAPSIGAEIVANMVGETTTTTGTGTLNLDGAISGWQTFVSGIGSTNTCRYRITDGLGNEEVGVGTVTDATPDTLSRDSVEYSTNGNALVDWDVGTKNVIHTVSASTINTKQDLDADLTYLAGFTPTANVKSILNAADYDAIRALMDLEAGTDFYDTSTVDSAISAAVPYSSESFQTFGAADATPDVSNGGSSLAHKWITGGVVTITGFDDGDDYSEFNDGDTFTQICAHAVTYDLTGTDLYGHGGEDYTAAVGDVIIWEFYNDDWYGTFPTTKTIDGLSLYDNTTPATDGMIMKYDNTTDDRYESVNDEFTECIYIEDPTADDDLQSIYANKTTRDFLLTAIWAESDQTVNFDLQIDDGSPADVNGTDISPAAGEAEDTSLSGDTTLAAGEELDLVVTSVSGTPTWVSICWTYNRK